MDSKIDHALEEWHADDVNGMGRCEYGDIEWDAKYIKKQWSKVTERLDEDRSSIRKDRWGRKIEDSEWEMMDYYDRLNHDFASWKPRGREDAMLIKTWNELYVSTFRNLHWLTRQRLVILMKMNQIQHRIYEWREKVWDLILRLGLLGVKWEKIVKLVEVLCPYKPYFKRIILENERMWKAHMRKELLEEYGSKLINESWFRKNNKMNINKNR